MINVCVFGLWHLGCVTAACVAGAGYRTIGIDPDNSVVVNLKAGRVPVFEPGLDELIQRGVASFKLTFSSDLSDAALCDLVWVTIDTPVDDNDMGDAAFVYSAIERIFPYLKDEAVLLVSSQLPVGSTRTIANAFVTR
jgi:UDPglucose 6-dehydrogenase